MNVYNLFYKVLIDIFVNIQKLNDIFYIINNTEH